jgi:hypothetical protein
MVTTQSMTAAISRPTTDLVVLRKASVIPTMWWDAYGSTVECLTNLWGDSDESLLALVVLDPDKVSLKKEQPCQLP